MQASQLKCGGRKGGREREEGRRGRGKVGQGHLIVGGHPHDRSIHCSLHPSSDPLLPCLQIVPTRRVDLEALSTQIVQSILSLVARRTLDGHLVLLLLLLLRVLLHDLARSVCLHALSGLEVLGDE